MKALFTRHVCTPLYEQLKTAGVPLDHHESDLYAKVTPESTRIIRAWTIYHQLFRSQIDGDMWYDIPFMYDPYWTARLKTVQHPDSSLHNCGT